MGHQWKIKAKEVIKGDRKRHGLISGYSSSDQERSTLYRSDEERWIDNGNCKPIIHQIDYEDLLY